MNFNFSSDGPMEIFGERKQKLLCDFSDIVAIVEEDPTRGRKYIHGLYNTVNFILLKLNLTSKHKGHQLFLGGSPSRSCCLHSWSNQLPGNYSKKELYQQFVEFEVDLLFSPPDH